jgi:DNA-binding NarL/FixJ family response regulator
MQDKIRVVIADDHQLIVDELQKLFADTDKYLIVGLYNNGLDLKQAIQNQQPNLIITDINMPGCTGLEICEWVKLAFPTIKIVLISMFYSQALINKLIQLKADGYLIKNSTQLEIEECIDGVMAGQTITTSNLKLEASANDAFLFPSDYLSETEKDVLKNIALGFSNIEIANKLGMAEFSIDSVRKIIYKKLNTGNIADLVSFANNLGLMN